MVTGQEASLWGKKKNTRLRHGVPSLDHLSKCSPAVPEK